MTAAELIVLLKALDPATEVRVYANEGGRRTQKIDALVPLDYQGMPNAVGITGADDWQ